MNFIYFAYIYDINNGSPFLILDLPIKASSLKNAWNEVIEIAFDSSNKNNNKMLRIIAFEDPF